MKSVGRGLVVCLCSCVGLCCLSAAAYAERAPSSGEAVGSPLGSALVIAGSPVEGEQVLAEHEAQLTTPEAVAEREASRTRFESMNAGQAEKVAEEAFPAVIEEPAGGPPKLVRGQSITGYPTDDAATVELPEGKRAVIESTAPIALEVASGKRVPVDLALSEAAGAFKPKTPLVGIQIPKRLGEGVQLASTGVSLTPLGAGGAPLGGSEGVLNDASVFFANTQTDSDTIVKGTTRGFEVDTLLRSVESPQELSFRVGLPHGTRLAQATDGSGAVEVVKEGVPIAAVLAPGARDAAGTSVPVSMTVSGDVLTLSLDDPSGEYRYPIAVDPTVTDSQLVTEFGEASNWREEPAPPSPFSFSETGTGYDEGELKDSDSGTAYARGEWGAMAYETQGDSHIFEFHSDSWASNAGSNIENKLFISSPGRGMEKEVVTGASYPATEETLCVESGCAPGAVEAANEHNAAEFKQTATNSGSEFASAMRESFVSIVQEQGPTITSINTTSKTIEGQPNVLYPGTWAGPRRGAAELSASDPGVGLGPYFGFEVTSPNKVGWSPEGTGSLNVCKGVQCSQNGTARWFWQQGLPSGEDTIEFWAKDGVGLKAEVSEKVKVDATLPYDITLSGLPANKEVGDSEVKVKATAKDGSETFSGSGIESISLKIDGKEVGTASGSCAPGPCTATSGEWTVNGTEYAAGQHKATVTATSYAGDVASEEFTFDTGHLAMPVPLGPGSVSPETGEFFLNATDVSVGGPGATLSVKRSYGSSHLAAGAEGPLGPQWSMSVGGSESLTKSAEGAVVLTNGEGQESVFTSKGNGEFKSPPNSASLTLTEVLEHEKTKEYVLKDGSGQITKFTLPSGGTGNTWVPASLEGPGATNAVTYAFRTTGAITEPTEVLAPVPAGVSCAAELVKGCRALGFVYAEKTTATGDSASEWGEYEGRLKEVTFTAWDPTSGRMTTTPIAEYAYDKEGKLRGEWNSSVSPALDTTYGYDTAGRVTAMTPPGQQPWLFDYGTTTNDPRARIVSITRPSASTAAGNGLAPVNTAAPVLSSSYPRVGVPLSVSNGTWSNDPLSYAYQWESCAITHEVEACSPILGATSQTYTPELVTGEWLAATVTATNADGSTTIATVHESKERAASGLSFKQAAWFGKEGSGKGEVKEPSAIAVESAGGSEGDVWVTDTGNNRIDKFTAGGTFVASYGSKGEGNGQFNGPVGIALGEGDQYVYVSDSGNKRIEVFEAKSGKYMSQIKVSGVPAGIATGKFHLTSGTNFLCIAVPNENNVRCDSIEGDELVNRNAFGSKGSGNGQMIEPTDVAITERGGDGEGNQIFVTDKGNHRVEIFEPDIYVIPYVGQFGSAGSGEGQFSHPEGIAVEPAYGAYSGIDGDVLVSDSGNNRVQISSPSGESPFDWNFGSGRQSLAVDTASGESDGDLYVASAAGSDSTKIAKWVPEAPKIEPPEPPNPGGSAVTTVEYQVPVSGSGAPYAMGKAEVQAWGQKDDPTEATAIFPPDEPMSWPAKNYRRATVYYLDGSARTVNVAHPGGGISTTEYNSTNNVERTLSPDNRAAALDEGSKSAQASELLDTENTYNSGGTELQSTLAPQHNVELADGTQVQARDHKQYGYDEGAPAEGGPYGLPTKTSEGALYSGEEADVRTTRMAYGGQEGLGWTLRKPTSVTTDPAGLDLVHKTTYEASTGNVVEARAPAGNTEAVYPPVFSRAFGSAGSGNGQLHDPEGVAVDSSGNLWVVDQANDRIEKFSGVGEYLAAYGSAGSGDDEFSSPWAIAINPSNGDVYVSDQGNSRIEELNAAGEFVEAIGWGVADGKAELEVCKASCKGGIAGSGNGQLGEPLGLTIDARGDIWVADAGNSRIEEFSEAGAYLSQFGSHGSGNGQLSEPLGVTIDEGELFVADYGNDRIEEFSPGGAYLGQFASKGSNGGQLESPDAIAANSTSGDLFVSDEGNSRVEEFSPAGKFLSEFGVYGTGDGQFHGPTGIAVNATGELYIADRYNARVQEWLPPGSGGADMVYSSQFGGEGSGNGQFYTPVDIAIDGDGDVWVTDFWNNRVQEFSGEGKFIAAYGSYGSGDGQFSGPTGVDVNQSTGDVYVGDCGNSRIEEIGPSGEYIRAFGKAGSEPGELGCPAGVKVDSSGDVWVADREHDRIEEYSSTGTFIATYGSAGSGDGQFKDPTGITVSGENIYVTDYGNDRVQELSSTGAYLSQFGGEGDGSGRFKGPEGITVDPAGNLYVIDNGNDRVQEFSASGRFVATFASYGGGEGQLYSPDGVAINAAGDMYVSDEGHDRVEKWDSVNQAVHDTKTIYYSAGANSQYPECGGHPEWANLACQTEPAAQPEDAPELPVSTFTYNMWDEVEKATETVGSSVRTTTATYDAAGRLKTRAISSTVGSALPAVTDEYNEKTGALEKQSTTSDGKTETITSVYNTLGELTSYADADENTSTYEYDVDGRIAKTNDGKGTQTYTYDSTTGDLTKLVDSAAGTFTATYDSEGNILSEGYPNGMSADYSYNATGRATSLRYVKTTHCSEKCTWFSDTVTPSIHGQWLEQASTLSHQAYAYDPAGRLTQVQSTPAGKGCTTRIYAYDEDTNRTSLTTREPGSGGECSGEGGTVEKHAYDMADRLIDAGTSYSPFGNITALPGADAGGLELTSAFYVDDQLAGQTQGGETIGYGLDPDGRTRETVSTGEANQDVVSHYASSASAPAWTIETPSGNWTRNIPGIGGGLVAVESDGEAPVLQLTNLHGDIIGTASFSETETKLLSSSDTSEFGVPTTSSPARYSWLGAGVVATELASGVIAMGVRSYVPELGRFLQPDPVPGGSADAYAYTFGDPVNTADPGGALTYGFSGWLEEANNQEAQEVVAREVARETLEREEAERRAREAREAEERADDPAPAAAEEPLGGYAGWACEYAAETGQEDPECEGGGYGRFADEEDRAKGNGDEWGVPEPGICVWAEGHSAWQWEGTHTRRYKTVRHAYDECERLLESRDQWVELDVPDHGSLPSDRG